MMPSDLCRRQGTSAGHLERGHDGVQSAARGLDQDGCSVTEWQQFKQNGAIADPSAFAGYGMERWRETDRADTYPVGRSAAVPACMVPGALGETCHRKAGKCTLTTIQGGSRDAE